MDLTDQTVVEDLGPLDIEEGPCVCPAPPRGTRGIRAPKKRVRRGSPRLGVVLPPVKSNEHTAALAKRQDTQIHPELTSQNDLMPYLWYDSSTRLQMYLEIQRM